MQVNPLVKKCPLRYFGGKWMLSPWIISHMRPHKVYVEPFFGGGSVLLRKPKANVEIIAEANTKTRNFWTVVRDDHEALIDEASKYEPSARLMSLQECGDSVKDAAIFWWKGQLAFQGVGLKWSSGTSSQRIEYAKISLKRNGIAGPIIKAHERMKGVQVFSDGWQLISRHLNNPEALIYLDPPYVHSSRKSKDGKHKSGAPRRQYLHEWSDADHVRLCEMLSNAECQWLLSGYNNPIYSEYLQYSVSKDCNNSDRNKGTEVLWMNQALWEVRPRAEKQSTLGVA